MNKSNIYFVFQCKNKMIKLALDCSKKDIQNSLFKPHLIIVYKMSDYSHSMGLEISCQMTIVATNNTLYFFLPDKDRYYPTMCKFLVTMTFPQYVCPSFCFKNQNIFEGFG